MLWDLILFKSSVQTSRHWNKTSLTLLWRGLRGKGSGTALLQPRGDRSLDAPHGGHWYPRWGGSSLLLGCQFQLPVWSPLTPRLRWSDYLWLWWQAWLLSIRSLLTPTLAVRRRRRGSLLLAGRLGSPGFLLAFPDTVLMGSITASRGLITSHWESNINCIDVRCDHMFKRKK